MLVFFFLTLFLCCCGVGVAFLCCHWHLVWVTVVVFVTLLFSHYFYTLLLVTLPLLFRLLLTLLFLLRYHSSHVAILFAPVFLPCYSFRVALLALLLLLHFRRLLAKFCCSSRTTILDPFAFLLLCFVWLAWYFPCPHHVQVRAQWWDTNSSTKCEFFCIFAIFLVLILFLFFFLLFLLYFCFCCYFCNFANFFVHFILYGFFLLCAKF
jgi:hypothetical protein